jgi:CDP-6-deoxy-D-xylo-4-hexulose-3-dehydrase
VTWPTQLSALLLAGYSPVLVDVDPRTLQMDPEDAKRKASKRTAAVFPVHVLGNMGNPAGYNLWDIPLLEDACEAIGSRWKGQHAGTFGEVGTYSFFFSHALTTMEGGMVVTGDAEEARRYRLWRAHGMDPQPGNRFHFPQWGLNLRPTEVQAALGLVQLRRLDGFLAARQRNFDRLAAVTYEAYPEVFRGVTVLPECRPAWHGFPLLVQPEAPMTRDWLCYWLADNGIENRPIITGNIARQPAVRNDGRVITGLLPGADFIHGRGFYIGLAPHDDEEGTEYVGKMVAEFVRMCR